MRSSVESHCYWRIRTLTRAEIAHFQVITRLHRNCSLLLVSSTLVLLSRRRRQRICAHHISSCRTSLNLEAMSLPVVRDAGFLGPSSAPAQSRNWIQETECEPENVAWLVPRIRFEYDLEMMEMRFSKVGTNKRALLDQDIITTIIIIIPFPKNWMPGIFFRWSEALSRSYKLPAEREGGDCRASRTLNASVKKINKISPQLDPAKKLIQSV